MALHSTDRALWRTRAPSCSRYPFDQLQRRGRCQPHVAPAHHRPVSRAEPPRPPAIDSSELYAHLMQPREEDDSRIGGSPRSIRPLRRGGRPAAAAAARRRHRPRARHRHTARSPRRPARPPPPRLQPRLSWLRALPRELRHETIGEPCARRDWRAPACGSRAARRTLLSLVDAVYRSPWSKTVW